jgi:L-asparaginase II
MESHPTPPVLVDVTRDGVVESVHRGHLAVCDPDGTVVAGLGTPEIEVYVRSAAKPFQALASLEKIDAAGVELGTEAVAIMCASHVAGDEHQIEAAHLLALADLDEDALGCPAALPDDGAALLPGEGPSRLAYNCSGKHGGFLLAEVCAGRDPAGYLDPAGPLQTRVRERLAAVAGATPTGPGVDGCGAPAWRLPLSALARAFARLIEGATPELARVRDAMTARPDLVGGLGTVDTSLMLADAGVVAKRGAEAVLAAGALTDRGPVGVAVKISDGGARATGPVVGAVLEALGMAVPASVLREVVLGGGQPHGAVKATPQVRRCAAP